MKTIILSTILFLGFLNGFSQTIVSSPITTNTTWALSGSPYIVTTNSGVFPGITLTIDPGVSVEFDNGLVFTVKGTLRALGTITDSITFTSSDSIPFTSAWQGLNIQNDQGGYIDFNYCKGLYTEYFLNFLANSSGSAARIRNSRFANNNYVIVNYDPSDYQITIDSSLIENNSFGSIYSNYLTITNSVFRNNDKCIHAWSGPTVQIDNTTFLGSTTYALNMSGTITNSRILDNLMGLRLRSDLILINDSIANNTVGIEVVATTPIPVLNVHDNLFCNNTSFDVKHTTSINVDLSNNCWCSYDSAFVSSKIWDAYDDLTLGIISYLPFDLSCDSNLSISQNENDFGTNIFPNPILENTTIEFNLMNAALVSLRIQDVRGKIIDTFINENMNPGIHRFHIENLNLESGIYICQFRINNSIINKKILVL